MALLGELPYSTGEISFTGQYAYTSQQPWVFTGTLRENVIFGRPYNKARYEEVLSVCALKRVCNVIIWHMKRSFMSVFHFLWCFTFFWKIRINYSEWLTFENKVTVRCHTNTSLFDMMIPKHIKNCFVFNLCVFTRSALCTQKNVWNVQIGILLISRSSSVFWFSHLFLPVLPIFRILPGWCSTAWTSVSITHLPQWFTSHINQLIVYDQRIPPAVTSCCCVWQLYPYCNICTKQCHISLSQSATYRWKNVLCEHGPFWPYYQFAIATWQIHSSFILIM